MLVKRGPGCIWFCKTGMYSGWQKRMPGIVLIPVHSIPYMRPRHQSHYPSGLPMNIPYQTTTSGSFKTCKWPFSNQLRNNTGENLVFVEKILVSNQLQNNIGKHLISIENILYIYIHIYIWRLFFRGFPICETSPCWNTIRKTEIAVLESIVTILSCQQWIYHILSWSEEISFYVNP